MHRLPARDWIEWFGSLHGPIPVEIRSPSLARPGRHVLGSAEYAPFDDLIELVFIAAGREWRLLLDHPRLIRVDGNAGDGSWQAEIHTAAVELLLQSAA
jgi:hypothetical protein